METYDFNTIYMMYEKLQKSLELSSVSKESDDSPIIDVKDLKFISSASPKESTSGIPKSNRGRTFAIKPKL